MTERILITGCSGYVGPWVAAQLRRDYPNATLCGVSRSAPIKRPAGPLNLHLAMDLLCPEDIRGVLSELNPTGIIHLASARKGTLAELLNVNVKGFENLLVGAEQISPNARIVCIGSASELGRASETDRPLNEQIACRPVDAYGVTKLAQSSLANVHAQRGKHIVCLRVFNLLGPAMPESLLPGRCIRLLKKIQPSAGTVNLPFGKLDTRRDYVDVRDVATVASLALRAGSSGQVYHVGSGDSHSGHEIVKTLIDISGLTKVTFSADDASCSGGVPFQTADPSLAMNQLTWVPQFTWADSLHDAWETT
ncbi:NAD-dependent epimerase/dehydratase family protein [Novipirellula sp. SH528]|uniref:NAD-dependent epimerase/dehydratase family protein n=1 Tax=Novipirellula sp. SH528 TaxID=3454466 RepID=UPI003FA14006